MRINLKSKILFVLLVSSHLSSENLLDIYNEALENDPTFRSAEYSYLADKEIVVQGRAALMPSVTLSGATNWNEYYHITLSLNQPEFLNLCLGWTLGLILKDLNL